MKKTGRQRHRISLFFKKLILQWEFTAYNPQTGNDEYFWKDVKPEWLTTCTAS